MQEKELIKLLNDMTLEEKIGQLIQISGDYLKDIEDNKIQTGPIKQLGISSEMIYNVGSVLNTVGVKNVIDLQRKYLEKSRLKIPLMFMADIINGYKTVFPIPLAQGCSWNTEVIKKCTEVSTKEASVAGVHVNFYPMLDLVRDARWGRVMESIGGEDMYLGEIYAKTIVNTMQGEDISEFGKCAACVKHFAGYGAVESGREYNKAGIDEKAEMVMTSFNTINGIPSTVNKQLLKKILREEYNFKGIIISDYSSIKEAIFHGVCKDEKEAALKAINAGVDIDMMSNIYSNYLKELVNEGKVDISKINEATLRVLKLKNKLKLFEKPYGNLDIEKEKSVLLSKENLEIARKVTAETFVLLKNNNGILPLNNKQKIALIGPYGNNKAITRRMVNVF